MTGYGVGEVSVLEEEKEPTGGELKVLINTVRWLGARRENRLGATTIPAKKR